MLNDFQNNLTQLVPGYSKKNFLIAVSGGIDSVVMAELFRLAGCKITIAHCNFRLRGAESRADEEFVWRYARTHKIPFHVKHFSTEQYAEKHKLSIQLAARELRYKWLYELQKKYRYDHIAIAHNSDDSIETFFINLLRGTGIAGLTGIPASGTERHALIRPLLPFSRKEIEQFARKNKIKWREDSSNATDKYERNRIRHHLLPMLEKIKPHSAKAILATMQNLREAEAVYRKAIDEAKGKIIRKEKERVSIDKGALSKLENKTLILYEIIKDHGFNYAKATNIIDALGAAPGKIFLSPTYRIVIDRQKIILEKGGGGHSDNEYTVKKSTKELITPFATLTFSTRVKDKGFKPPSAANSAYLDYEKLHFPLIFRKWREGDRFHPLGMNKPKKVSDLLIDLKVPLPDKEKVHVLISGKDIIWVVGRRIDERYKITSATKKMYVCELT